MNRQFSFRLSIVILAVSVLLIQVPVLAAPVDSLDIDFSYSDLEKADFSGEYLFDSWGLGLYYSDKRYQTSVLMKPSPDFKLKLGYDVTEESYLAGFDHRWRIGENLVVDSEVMRFWPKENGDTGVDYLDYKFQLDIGIGHNNFISPGLKGYYSPDYKPDPEFFIHFDLNWSFGDNYHLQFEPHILVEGDAEHQITLTKEFDNGIKAGVFTGQNREQEWDFGVTILY